MKTPINRKQVIDLMMAAIYHADPTRENADAEAIFAAFSRAGLAIVKGFDTSTAPHDAVRDAVPLVLYFASRADADEFAEVVMEAKPGMVAHEVMP